MTISDSVRDRGIEEILHFTTNRGTLGIIATHHVFSRRRLPEKDLLKHILHPGAPVRPEEAEDFDKAEDWLDYVNLSISEINSRYFRLARTRGHNRDVWWAIMSFDPIIATHDGVYFATTNNAYEHCVRSPGVGGFDALFAPIIRRKSDWRVLRGNRADHLPTCEQAEVLYPGTVPIDFLRRIYVRNGDHYDDVRGWLRQYNVANVEVVESEEQFHGEQN